MSDISTIICTFQRPRAVVQAIRSALAQTCRPLEIIVVVDGRDDATVAALRSIGDSLVKVVVPDRHLGNAAARNLGIAYARGEWIATLDDDDLWLPKKLETQLRCAAASTCACPIIGCRVIARTSEVDLIWPRRFPRPGEALCEYMCRRSLPLSGEGLVQSSMIVAPRELFERVQFDGALKQHVDSDWVLRAAREPAVRVIFPETREPLAVWNIDSGRPRVSSDADWRKSLAWGRRQLDRGLFTRRAYAGFVCKNVSALARASGHGAGLSELWREARRRGRPSWVDLVSHLMNFGLPTGARDMLWRIVPSRVRRG